MIPPPRLLRRIAFALAASALIAGAVVGLTPKSPTVASASSSGWVETWAAAMTKPTPMVANRADAGFRDQTIRNVIFTSVGGQEVRIRLSNRYGDRPLHIGQASVGVVASDGNLSGPAYAVTFDGSRSVVVPAGEEVVSDAVAMPVSALEDLAVSIYVPQATGPATFHFFGEQNNYLAHGNHVSDVSDRGYPTHDTSWYFLDGVEVLGADKRAGTVVAFGDSITDGIGSTPGRQPAVAGFPGPPAGRHLRRRGAGGAGRGHRRQPGAEPLRLLRAERGDPVQSGRAGPARGARGDRARGHQRHRLQPGR